MWFQNTFITLILELLQCVAGDMGNQCLKKISDGDKDGYKQHNQMYFRDRTL